MSELTPDEADRSEGPDAEFDNALDGTATETAVPNRRSGTSPRSLLAAGVALLIVALLAFAGSRVIGAGQRHAYDPGATPPSSYHLTAGKTYQLSYPGGVRALTAAGIVVANGVQCTGSDGSGVERSLTIQSTRSDDRDITVFATFIVDSTGDYRVSCDGIRPVFVDDADNTTTDYAGALVVLASILAVVAVAVIAGAAYRLSASNASHRPETLVEATDR